MSTATDIRRPSAYQITSLRVYGIRRRPSSYDRAKALLDQTPPSEAQRTYLREAGLPMPATRADATAALSAYEAAHPEQTAARMRARIARGVATRRANAGASREFDAQVIAFHAAAVALYPAGSTPSAASAGTIAKLPTLAAPPEWRRAPAVDDGGPQARDPRREAGSRIGRITSRLNRQGRGLDQLAQ